MDNRPIGVFDSGLGGLTAVRELRAILPGEDIVYFGDTGRVPYGPRGEGVITRYAREDAAFLLEQGVKAVVCACGTVSSVAGEVLAASMECPFVEVVTPAARAACAATKNRRIGVIATPATIRSGKFPAAVARFLPEAEVFPKACPLFVPLVEDGHIAPGDPLATPAVAYYLRELRDWGMDTLILGCTHYPLLAPLIRDYLGPEVTLVSAGQEAAFTARDLLAERELFSEKDRDGSCRYCVTDAAGSFSQVAEVFLGAPVEKVQLVDITRLEHLAD
jgi:glutamate racemase